MAASSFPISPTTTVFTSSYSHKLSAFLNFSHNCQLSLPLSRALRLLPLSKEAMDLKEEAAAIEGNGFTSSQLSALASSPTPASTIEEKKIRENERIMDLTEEAAAIRGNGFALKNEAIAFAEAFIDPRWVKGNWDLSKFEKNGKADWDAVIDAGEIFCI